MDEKKIDPALWIFLIYLVLFIVMYLVSPMVVGAVILGLYLSMIIMVPARLLMKIKFLGYRAAIVISSVLLFSLLAFTIFQIFPIVIDEGKKLFNLLASENSSLSGIMNDLPRFIKNSQYSKQVMDLIDQSGGQLVSSFSSFGMRLLNTSLQKIPGAFTATIIFIIAASYLSFLIPTLRTNMKRFFPASTRDKSVRFVSEYYGSIKSFIGGQMIIAAIVGLLIGIGMTIAGIPYAIFMGFLSFITNFIPFFGVVITAVPAIFLGIANYGIFGLVRVGIVLLVANQIEAWVLSPKIQGERMELNWFVILIGILLFGGIFGIVGVLFAVPIMVFIKKFWIEYVQEAFNRI